MSSPTTAPFDLGRFTGVCAASGRTLVPGDRTVAVVVEDPETGALKRRDYGETEWDAGTRPTHLFCFWRRVVPESGAKPTPFIDDEELVALFEGLAEAEGERQRGLRFILALLLVRKRLYRHVGTDDRRGERVMLLRRRGAGRDEPSIEVADPGLDAGTVAAATEQLGLALRGEE